MVGGTIPPQSDSGEISRVLVLNLLWQSKRCSRTAQDISVLTTPSLLSKGHLARLIGDKAYDSDRLDRELAERYGIEMIAPHRGERRRRRKMVALWVATADVGESN